jgi:hypothetical protein
MGGGGRFYVYEHWRLDRDECFYVGKGKGGRAYSMKNRNRHHQAIVAKLGRIGSAFEVKIVASGLLEETAFMLERERIAFWRASGVDLTNMTNGGDGVRGLSQEVKDKIAFANVGNKYNLGRFWTLEQRVAMSQKKQGCQAPFETEKMRENRAKNCRKAALERRRKVVCVNDELEFNSVVDAANHYNLSKSTVSAICRKRRNAAYGLKFKFKEIA